MRFVIFSLVLSAELFGQWTSLADLSLDARNAGLGRLGVTGNQAPGPFVANPALLAESGIASVFLGIEPSTLGTTLFHAGGAFKLLTITYGFHFTTLGAESFPYTDPVGNQNGETLQIGESLIALGAGYKLELSSNLFVNMGIELLSAIQHNGVLTTPSLDMGLGVLGSLKFGAHALQVGVSVLNLIVPTTNFTRSRSFHLGVETDLTLDKNFSLMPSIEMQISSGFSLRFSLETKVLQFLFLRVGVQPLREDAFFAPFSTGVGFQLKPIGLDYAFRSAFDGRYSAHSITFHISFPLVAGKN